MTAPTLPPASGPGQRHPERPEGAAPSAEPTERPRGRRLPRPHLPTVGLPVAPALVSLLAAAWAIVIGLGLAVVPLLLVWMTTTASGLTWGEAVRLGGVLWLVANGASVTIAGLGISLVPWGLVLVALVLLGVAGGWAARRVEPSTPRAWMQVLLPGAVLYSGAAAALAVLTAGPTASVPAAAAAFWSFVVAMVGLGLGALRVQGLPIGIPRSVITVVRAGLVAAFTLLALGAVAATAFLVMHFDDAITMAQSLQAGVAGGLGLLALGVAYVPVMAVWGMAYVMGAGILIGPGITVSPFLATTSPTALPPFPLLAALPQGATVIGWLLPVSGVLAGVVAGALIARRARTETRLTRLAMAGCAAIVAGGAMGVMALLGSGGLGDLRLAQLGPVPMTVAVLGAVLVALGAVPSAIVGRSPDRPRLSVASPDAAPADSLDVEHTRVAEPPREDA